MNPCLQLVVFAYVVYVDRHRENIFSDATSVECYTSNL